MFEIVRIVKQALAGLGAGFGGTLAAVAALAEALKVDVAAGKQLVIAAVAAVIAAALGAVGNLVKQLRERI